jgi:hypothetical protein
MRICRMGWMGAVIAIGAGLSCNAILGIEPPEHEDGHEDGGVDPCAGVTCTALDACHEAGQCDPATGACSNPPIADGTPCDDGSLCTQTDACHGGDCVGSKPVMCPVNADACQPGCDPATGLCTAPNGIACDDGNVCTSGDACQDGVCNPSSDHAWAHWHPTALADYAWTDDVVVDHVTGRTWQRVVPGGTYTWQDAQAYCSSLNLPGYPSGWRLPTRIELVSIVDYAKIAPAIDAEVFPDTPFNWYWSSSVYAGNPVYAWIVNFDDGAVYPDYVGDTPGVRCVR